MIIDGHKPEARLEQLKRCIPNIFKYNTLLYIGGHTKFNRNLQLCDQFLEAGYDIDVVEAFEPNVKDMAEKFKWINKLYHGDIRTFEIPSFYDVIMFWHGPEHLTHQEAALVTAKLKPNCRKLVYATPWGKSPQGVMYNNPYEVHVSDWYPHDFKRMGMNVDTIGRKDIPLKNNLLAWI